MKVQRETRGEQPRKLVEEKFALGESFLRHWARTLFYRCFDRKESRRNPVGSYNYMTRTHARIWTVEIPLTKSKLCCAYLGSRCF